MKQKLILTAAVLVFIIVGIFGFMGSSLMNIPTLQEADAGIWHYYDCTFDDNGNIKHCREVVYHGTTTH